MSGNKSRETDASVSQFINAVVDEVTRADSWTLVEIMSSITNQPAKMWGTSIVGYGTSHYVYESGREGDMPVTAFSPRKAAITLYLNNGEGWEANDDLMSSLGKHKMGKGCLYIKRLSDVDIDCLTTLIERSARSFASTPPGIEV